MIGPLYYEKEETDKNIFFLIKDSRGRLVAGAKDEDTARQIVIAVNCYITEYPLTLKERD